MTSTTRRVATFAALASPRSNRLHRRLRASFRHHVSRVTLTVATIGVLGFGASSWAAQPAAYGEHPTAQHKQSRRIAASDQHVGYASYYANKFFGRRMADGTPMRPESDNAASLTLPLGSKAMVTNLLNGRRALVTIRDRGPFIKGRIIDVSPSTARLLGILHVGVAKVAVIPLDQLDAADKLDAIIASADAADALLGDDTP